MPGSRSRNSSKKSLPTKERKSSQKGQQAVNPSSGLSLATAKHEQAGKTKTQAQMLLPPPPPQKSLFQNVTSNSVKRSSSKIVIRSSMAAAMLSFPWPPPETSKLVLAKLREEQARKKLEADVESIKKKIDVKHDGENGNCCSQQPGSGQACCCGTTKSKAPSNKASSRKLYMKKKCQSSVDPLKFKNKQQQKCVVVNGEPQRKPGEPYLPVTIPPFTHVHTAWPGFDHAPVPNWQRKYLIAKPWPYKKPNNERVRFDLNKLEFPEDSVILNRPSAQTDLLNRHFTGRSLASSLTPSTTGGLILGSSMEDDGQRSDEGGSTTTLLKSRIRLQRVGSCLT